MKRIKITIAYDGTNYCGWQVQPNGITIEEIINKKLSKLTGEQIVVIGASRTDSGVHALGNVAVFDTNTTIPPERISHALNQRLPEDIHIMKSEEVPSDFHPRYCNCKKTYEYNIINTRTPIPTKRLTNYFVSYELDIENMKKAATYLIGQHDFVSFCNIRTNVENTVRTVTELEITTYNEEIKICITGTGFLYNMVRIIVGTLIRVGRGYYKPEQVKEILEARDRKAAGVTAPANGLMLVRIDYE
ncbi:MAG: tRNA pseudouridine(38-40) synthase TruA [Lachnospiraceae bacterium]|nr:tRNA pseudouridine(38-40) synthase TruA [Lachnospiraceae bacterium]